MVISSGFTGGSFHSYLEFPEGKPCKFGATPTFWTKPLFFDRANLSNTLLGLVKTQSERIVKNEVDGRTIERTSRPTLLDIDTSHLRPT